MRTEFEILGPLRVMQQGVPCELGSLRQRGLLARLIIRADQPITADQLIDELWPGDVPDTARHTLHVYVSRLRAILGEERDRLTSDPTGYSLRIEQDELDAARFERLAAEGRVAFAAGDAEAAGDRSREALGMWRGPALVEFAGEDFAAAEATRLDQLRLDTLEHRIRAELAQGRHPELVEELRSLTLEHPFRETFWELYMLALYRAGRQTEALRVFGEARVQLSDELGIEPGPALRRMEQRVLDQDPELELGGSDASLSLPAPTRDRRVPMGNLPLQRTTFIGRERDLAIAGELLAASRLLTLTGAPGSGKTRMALRLATEHDREYPDGAVFIPLASITEPTRVESVVAAAVRDTLPDGRSNGGTPTALPERLRGQRCLLLLDNCEHLAGGFGFLGQLLDAAPDLRVLATSRAPLRLAGEQEFPVLPLERPSSVRALDPTSLDSYDAVALLVSRARAADPSFEVTAENAGAIVGIVSRLDGLPLAIELGAGRLRSLTPSSLLARLEHRLPLLTSGASDAIGRHQTLRAAITWSYELLAPSEQLLFRHLAIFVSAFTVEGGSFVADLPEDEVLDGIEVLLSNSLLSRPADTGEARFAMLQTLREYALEQLEAENELQAASERHARHCLRIAEAVGPDLQGSGHDAAVARLGREAEDVRAAVGRCVATPFVEIGLRLVTATWRYWQATGRSAEAREWLAALMAQPSAPSSVRAAALTAAAGLAYWQADYDTAWSDYEEALQLYRELDDQADVADTVASMSMTATWRGDATTGASLASEARGMFEELGIRAKVGEAAMAQGFALWQQRRYEEARPLWEDALAISREDGADTLAVTQLAAVAGLEFHMGAPEDALRIALDALDQACDLRDVALCVWMLDFVAAFGAAAKPTEAVRVAAAADALRRASGGGMSIEDLRITPAREVAHQTIGRAAAERAWSDGRSMQLEEAITAARSLRPVSHG